MSSPPDASSKPASDAPSYASGAAEGAAAGHASSRGSSQEATEPRSPDDEGAEGDGAVTEKPRTFRLSIPTTMSSAALVGLFVLAAFYTMYFASSFFLPVVIAVLLNFLLSPLVRWLSRLHIPVPIAAAVVMLGFLGTLAVSVYYLSGPASEWIERAPETLREVEYELRGVRETVEKVQEATQQAGNIAGQETAGQQAVRVESASASNALLSQTTAVLAGTAACMFLLYFLLASGDLFLRKLVHVLPLFRRKRIAVQIAHGIERDLSRYLFTYAIINTVLGAVVAFALWLIGMPNPILWGLMVGVLNFVPYLGPLVGVTIVGLVAFVSFDDVGTALLAPALYFSINALEGNLVTPMIMGQRLQLNPVAIFIALTFWGWMWGIPGALIAVPLLVALKIVCDNVATLQPLGEFLGN